jgi:hypothetical protein
MEDRTVNVLASLQVKGIGERPLVFVTHSMGGLIVKEALLHAAYGGTEFSSFASATKGVVFLGTPHNGSGLIRAVSALGKVYRGTPAVSDLRRNSAHLRQLSTRYQNCVHDSVTGIRHEVFFETKPTKGMQVVDAGSANPSLPKVQPVAVDANHVDICKPANRDSLVYGRIRNFVADIAAQAADAAEGIGGEILPRVCDIHPLDVGVKPSVPVAVSDSPIALWLKHKTPHRRMSSYTIRDHDADLRARLTQAAKGLSGAVILIGRSCTGKSRSAWEAVSEILPGWHFANMGDPADIAHLRRAGVPEGGVVLWLDNLRAGTGVADAVKAALAILRDRRRTHRALAVATMWHAPAVGSANQPTALADSFTMKELATYTESVVSVEETWSDAERQRGWARSLEAEDDLLAAALRLRNVSPPQMLAGAHWTINLWQSPVKRETRSLLTAAIDLAGFGFGVDPRPRAGSSWTTTSAWRIATARVTAGPTPVWRRRSHACPRTATSPPLSPPACTGWRPRSARSGRATKGRRWSSSRPWSGRWCWRGPRPETRCPNGFCARCATVSIGADRSGRGGGYPRPRRCQWPAWSRRQSITVSREASSATVSRRA